MSNLDKLISHFEKFPGIGGRQAKRFAFHILTLPEAEAVELSQLIGSLKNDTTQCASCQRYFSVFSPTDTLCSICSNPNRDHNKLMIVATDNDVVSIERSRVYDGLYFVLGGMVPLLHTDNTKKLRGGLLKATIEARLLNGLNEVIVAFAINPDGENTARFVEAIIKPLKVNAGQTLRVSHLGRGLSTGSELEYADPETIKNALQNRS